MVIFIASVVALLWAAHVVMAERFGSAPIPAAQGSTAPFARRAARTGSAGYGLAHAVKQAVTHATTTLPNVAARKADDRARPRGRRL